MENLMYYVAIFVLLGTGKTVLALLSYPTAYRTARDEGRRAGFAPSTCRLIALSALVTTVLISFFLWAFLLYKEGLSFFAAYSNEDVADEVRAALAGVHDKE